MAVAGTPTDNDCIRVINEHIKGMRAWTGTKKLSEPPVGKIFMHHFDRVCTARRESLVGEIIGEVQGVVPETAVDDVLDASISIASEVEDFESNTYGELFHLLVEAVEDLTRRLEDSQK